VYGANGTGPVTALGSPGSPGRAGAMSSYRPVPSPCWPTGAQGPRQGPGLGRSRRRRHPPRGDAGPRDLGQDRRDPCLVGAAQAPALHPSPAHAAGPRTGVRSEKWS